MASGKHISDEIEKEIAAATSRLSESQLKIVGEQAINVIVMRTKSGVDADHKQFTPYSPGYKKTRERIGRSSSTVDLAITGHMQQAMESTPGDGEVSIGFMNPLEEKKAEIHNSGVDKQVSVRSHTRSAYIDKKSGRRVSRKEAKRDSKRKNPRVMARTENVSMFQRHQVTPKREWFDIRYGADIDAVGSIIAELLTEGKK